jgi:hypothetical protein
MTKQAHGSVAADKLRGRMYLPFPKNEKGMALMTVLVFSFIFLILTMTFFTVAGYEAGQAENRENSTRAFYMADGAIEKAKSKLLEDGFWTAGFPKTGQDGGFYKLTVDTALYQGAYHKRFYAEGYFGRTKRDVEVIADIVPATLGLAIYARSNIELRGNICLDGHAHADEEIDGEEHFDTDCGPTWSSGTDVDPPPVYIEPDSFPGATYYYVTANARPGNNPDTLFFMDRNFNNIPGKLWVNTAEPHPDFDWSFDNNSGQLNITIRNAAIFDTAGTVFPKNPGDSTVVINFGGRLKDYVPSYLRHTTTNLTINVPGANPTTIYGTIINTRYRLVMADTEERLDRTRWMGGQIETRSWARFEPTYCIAFIAQTIRGNAQQSLGTPDHPALSYIIDTGDFSVGQWTIYGSLVSLGDITVGGGVNLTFSRDFIDCLPGHLSHNWPEGSSGVMNVLRWREPPPRT